MKDGEPCSHPGCLRHFSHPCEVCGRIGGKRLQKGVCRICGCTQHNACVNAQGEACAWADESRTLCTFCFRKRGESPMLQLSEKAKKEIDEMDYASMLRRWRFAPSGDIIFQGESGEYFAKAMAEKKKAVDHVAISKAIGWGR